MQTNTDNGSDTTYKLTRSSPLHINHSIASYIESLPSDELEVRKH